MLPPPSSLSYDPAKDHDIETWLDQHNQKQLLRFVTIGSVDDGKSTLIGRILHDAGQVYDDHLADATVHDKLDLSRLTDGLRAEREQGITIDVAYRYFSTARRKFILADTPGHVQYTRNMATGASTAHVAIILLDARLGVLPQSRRHAQIASLLGIPYLFVAVNKMDLVEYSREVYEAHLAAFRPFLERLSFREVRFFPVSALEGDNVVRKSEKMAWFESQPLLEHLETVPLDIEVQKRPFRFPVQYVLRPDQEYRGFAGQIVSGVIRPDDQVMILPSRKLAKIRGIDTYDGPLDRAYAPMSVSLRLDTEVDTSRGEMLVSPAAPPRLVHTFSAIAVWMHEAAFDPQRSYLIKHTTRTSRVSIDAIHWKSDPETLDPIPAHTLALNDIGCLTLTSYQPLFVDAYEIDRSTGSFILMDSLTNHTVAAGMILASLVASPSAVAGVETLAFDPAEYEGSSAPIAPPSSSSIPRHERKERLGHAPGILWLQASVQPSTIVQDLAPSDASASSKGSRPTDFSLLVAQTLERRIFDRGFFSALLDARPFSSSSIPLTAAANLYAAGLLVVCLAKHSPPALSSFPNTHVITIRLSEASDDPQTVVDDIFRWLEQRGVFTA